MAGCPTEAGVGARTFIAWQTEKCFNSAQQSAAFGADGTNPNPDPSNDDTRSRLHRLEILSEAVVTEIATLNSEALTPERAITKRVQGNHEVGGDITVELSNDGFAYLIGEAIGKIIPRDSTDAVRTTVSAEIGDSAHPFVIEPVDSAGLAVNEVIDEIMIDEGQTDSTYYDSTDTGVSTDSASNASYTVNAHAMHPGMSWVIGRDPGTIGDPNGAATGANKNLYTYYTGMKVNTFAITANPGEIATATFGLLGARAHIPGDTVTDQDIATGGAGTAWAIPVTGVEEPTDVVKGLQDPFTGFDGKIFIDNVSQCILSFEMTLNNDMATDRFCLGDKFRNSLPEQRRTLEGTITVEFRDMKFLKQFLDGNASWLELVFQKDAIANPQEIAGKNDLVIILPKIEFNGAGANAGGPEALVQELPFTALFDDDPAGSTLKPTKTRLVDTGIGFDIQIQITSGDNVVA